MGQQNEKFTILIFDIQHSPTMTENSNFIYGYVFISERQIRLYIVILIAIYKMVHSTLQT
jgi:hypothetical protein